MRGNLALKFIQSMRSKTSQVLKELSNQNLNINLNFARQNEKHLRNALATPPDFSEVNEKHEKHLNSVKIELVKMNCVRRIIFAQKTRVKLALRILHATNLSAVPGTNVSSDKLVLNTIALNYKIKLLDSLQVLRFPTIKRHEKQKSAIKIESVFSENLRKKQLAVLNSFIKKTDAYPKRYNQLLTFLFNKTRNNLKFGFFCIS